MLRFWVARGLLLPEGEPAVTPQEAAEQRRLRKKVCRLAQKYEHHRKVEYLAERMASWDAAAPALGWGKDAVNAAALSGFDAIRREPHKLVAHVVQLRNAFSRHECSISEHDSMYLAKHDPDMLELRVSAVLDAIKAWPVEVDPAVVLSRNSSLLAAADFGVFEERVIALQQLHPQLDVTRVINGAPTILNWQAATVAAQWQLLQSELGLSAEQAVELLEYQPMALLADKVRAAAKVAAVRQFDERRRAMRKAPHAFFFPSWMANIFPRSAVCILRLSYLTERAAAGDGTALAKPGCTIVRQADARFDGSWPGFSEWCIDRMASTDSRKI